MIRHDTALPPRLPVIIGVGQLNRRVDHGETALAPTEMMAEALRIAAGDAGPGVGLLVGADSIRVVKTLSWRYRDPGALVAHQLGAVPRHTAYTTDGGNSPQMLVNQAAEDIQAGHADLVLLTGAEAWRTRTAARSAGGRPDWPSQGDDVPLAEVVGSDHPLSNPNEVARGIFMPVQIYPLFESAIAAASGRSPDEHRAHLGRLWSGFSQVAADNPNAWLRESLTPGEIATVTPENRMIGFPYTKRMNANNSVEQAAAVVMCSVERARSLGVPSDRWVFPLAGTEAHDTYFVSNRRDLRSSPAIGIGGRKVLALAGVGVDDLAHLDIYSCFPSVVQIAVAELGIGLDRPLTVTGGLSFAGGPWNNYVMHSIAAMADRLRAGGSGEPGLVTANGGYVTKHAFGVYATEPPAAGRFARESPQDEVDAVAGRGLCEEWDGPATIEASTVLFDRGGGHEYGLVAALLADGRRAWGRSTDPATMEALVSGSCVGRAARLTNEGNFELT